MRNVLCGIVTHGDNKSRVLILDLINSIFSYSEIIPNLLIINGDCGYPKACNNIIDSRKDNQDVLIMNDDIIWKSDIIKEIQKIIDLNKDIMILGGCELESIENIINNFGIKLYNDFSTKHQLKGTSYSDLKLPYYDDRVAVSGALFYIKSEFIDTWPHFDENYGHGYREELDYCLLCHKYGYKVASVTNAKYLHFESITNNRLGKNIDKNAVYFENKWRPHFKFLVDNNLISEK